MSTFFLLCSKNPAYRLLNGSEDKPDEVHVGHDASDEAATKLKLVPGLSGTPGTVSFENAKRPGYYYRHKAYWLCEHNYENDPEPELMASDSSWFVRAPLKVPDADRKSKRGTAAGGVKVEEFVSFESENFPGHYLTHVGNRLKIVDIGEVESKKHMQNFKADATWKKS